MKFLCAICWIGTLVCAVAAFLLNSANISPALIVSSFWLFVTTVFLITYNEDC